MSFNGRYGREPTLPRCTTVGLQPYKPNDTWDSSAVQWTVFCIIQVLRSACTRIILWVVLCRAMGRYRLDCTLLRCTTVPNNILIL
ncbi:hypothetical protein CEXT_114521 [Caerostris extrusa]|uniref:Uncharacterized protein n=1 Tax=Caerostris extrusa TaxID=172846 RepID=A0AAV4MVP1_CAEEX|nr:hypothetical protein CEXT_114521 [Caerostris extrusa]